MFSTYSSKIRVMETDHLSWGMNDAGGIADSRQLQPPHARRNLPIELVCHIIACVDRKSYEGVQTIRSCSFVCQEWLAICLPRLFESLKIVIPYDLEHKLSFYHFTAPHLCQYLRSLRLVYTSDSRPEIPKWTPEGFARFKNLRALRLVCSLEDREAAEWMQLRTPISLGLTALLTSPRLEELTIERWDFGADPHGLLHMLSLCSTLLKKLSLKRVSTWEECRIDETSESSVLTLEALSNLSLERVDHVAIKAALVRCPNLKSLSASIIYDMPVGFAWTIPPYVSSRLEELHLHVRSPSPIPYFDGSVRLSALEIDMHAEAQGHAALLDSSIWLKGCILNLPFPELLSRLTLDISSHVAYSDFYFPQPADFEPLSTSLASLRDSGMLKRIRINVVVTVYRDIHNVPIDISRTGDVRKIRDGFVPILGPGVDVEVVLNVPGGGSWISLGDEGDRLS